MIPFPGSRLKDLYVDTNNDLFIRIFRSMVVKNKNHLKALNTVKQGLPWWSRG